MTEDGGGRDGWCGVSQEAEHGLDSSGFFTFEGNWWRTVEEVRIGGQSPGLGGATQNDELVLMLIRYRHGGTSGEL